MIKIIYISIFVTLISLAASAKIRLDAWALTNSKFTNTTIPRNNPSNVASNISSIFNNFTSDNGKLILIPYSSEFGIIITDQNKLPLYTYDNDTESDKSSCYGSCAVNWPPLQPGIEPIALAGYLDVDIKLINRTDGIMQVVYKGKPLYYFFADTGLNPNGQGLAGIWWLINADGSLNKNTIKISSDEINKNSKRILDIEQNYLNDNLDSLRQIELANLADTDSVEKAWYVFNSTSADNSTLPIAINATYASNSSLNNHISSV